MAGGINLAKKYSKKIDERFSRESQAMLALNNDYEFTGVKTVNVYSIPVVPMTDYSRSGSNRYGTPDDLTRNIQELTVTKDRSFTFIIDKGDKIQSEMVSDAGKALSRQTREVCVPEFDAYVYKTLAAAAIENGNYVSIAATKTNAYELFLAGMESLGNKNVPDKGRVAFCSYKFANLLKQDPAFMKYGNASQEMIIKGVIGECDGCKIVKVPSSRLPAGTAFIIAHPSAATAPKQLEEFKVHDNPPGISGWLVEGRLIYDCFVLNEKADAIYYCGGQQTLKTLVVGSGATGEGKTTVTVTTPLSSDDNQRYYKTGSTLTAVNYGDNIAEDNSWTVFEGDSIIIEPSAGDKVVQVIELGDDGVIATGNAKINIG